MKKTNIIKKISLTLLCMVSAMPVFGETPTSWIIDSNAQKRKSVELLYKKWYSGPLHHMLTSGRRASRLSGKWANSKRSRHYIRRFIKNYHINVNEIAEPLSSFKTFNDFFVRKLKPEVRPLSKDPNAIVSPADGNALVMLNINKEMLFPTKTVSLSASTLLKDAALAQLFEGGTVVIIRLAPWDYHRVHFPLTGIPGVPRNIGGRFESVSPEVYQAGIQPLEINERHVIRFQSDKASIMAIVLVGALFVGAIVETYMPGKKYKLGDEMGYFEYGGSTMVMFFQKNTINVLPQIVSNSAAGIETPVKMGQAIGQVIKTENKEKSELPPELSTWDV